MNAIELRNISKTYPLGGSQWSRFRYAVSGGRTTAHSVEALHDISFEVRKGEAFGIVGANGSGKSTLLQIVAGILRPSSGSVEIQGRLSALLELGSGFSPEFTGRQNVYLNASILGLTLEETDARFEIIERFASIGAFIDQPIRTYSTGMVLRLAFAVVAYTDPEILIVDEALAVGDIAFRQRCMLRIHELRAAGVTILFVSHDSGDVKALCSRCLWLENGTTRMLGDTDEVVAGYLSATVQRERARETATHHSAEKMLPERRIQESARPIEGRSRYGSGAAVITGADWEPTEAGVLRLTFVAVETIANPIAGFLVRNEKGETIFGVNSTNENILLPEMSPGDSQNIEFRLTMPELAAGRYFISIAVSDGTLVDYIVCDYVEDALTFESRRADIAGYVRIPCVSVSIQRQ